MNSLKYKSPSLSGLEHWIETIRVGDGFGGPAVGLSGTSMDYCGPAFDWRCEGIFDAMIACCRTTGRTEYLDRITQCLQAVISAQLINGTFRNSWFHQNPYEGGMPYEPAMLAAACRARKMLVETNRSVPEGFDAALERFVEIRLLNELWNRLLHTFNDWLQSNFDHFTPHSVAAVIELLLDYAELSSDWKRLEYYVTGAADSLLAVQRPDGAIPLSSRPNSTVSPALAARCIPALVKAAQKTGNEKYRTAAGKLVSFIRAQQLPDGGYTCLIHCGRPAQTHPVILGAAADAVNAIERAGMLIADDVQRLNRLLSGSQLASGAFRTAFGFGSMNTPDWRDILPCCGWQDKIYSFLARHRPDTADADFAPGDVRCPVQIRGKTGEYKETPDEIRIFDRRKQTVYHWQKGSKWASVNRL
jgi:hypothetical protein